MLPLLLALGLAAAPSAPAAAEPAPGAGGALRITADPPRLVLGRDGAAELRIAAPPEVEDLQLSTSAGRVENVRRLPAGGFVAHFRPPPERIPQIALVSALARTSRGVLDGWLAIPLSGQADAKVRAKPGAEIALRIADLTFGPRTTGPDGVAVIPVVVPPGVREAHHGFRPIDLHVPETSLLHAVEDRTRVQADRSETVRVLTYVVAPHGAARRGDVPVFEPSRGTVSATAREPGAFEVLWLLPPGPAGEDRLVVRLPGSPASRTVLRLEAIAGPPAAVAVAFDREAFVAGEGDEVAVTARAVDAAGNVSPAAVRLEADAGTLSAPVETAPGVYTARLRLAPDFRGRGEVVVTARADAAGLSGRSALPLVAGAPATVRVVPEDPVVLADGTAEATLRVVTLDRYGNPLGAAPDVSASAGRVRTVERFGGGGWRVRYRPTAVAARTEVKVVAAAGPVKGDASLLLVPARPPVTIAATGGVALDFRDRFAGPAFGLAVERTAAIELPLPNAWSLAWRLEAGGVGWSTDVHVERPAEGTDALRRRAGLVLGGLSLHHDLRGAEGWASSTAGLALAWAARDGASADVGIAPAARVALGLGLPRTWGTPFLEASVLGAGRTPAGAFLALGLSVGVKLDLGGERWRRSSSSTTSR